RRVGIVLGLCDEDAADCDIVELVERRGLRLRNGLETQTDDRVRAEQSPRVGCRHVVLADMNTFGLRGQRDVDAVVDQQWSTGRLERGVNGTRLLNHRSRRAMLVA